MYGESLYQNFLNAYSDIGQSDNNLYTNYMRVCENNCDNGGGYVLSQNTFNKLLSDVRNIEKF